MNLKVPYLVKRRNRDGSFRFYWQPKTEFQKAGWKTMPLGKDEAAAIKQAKALNEQLSAWRKGATETSGGALASSVRALIVKYRTSPKFARLTDKTRQSYDQNLDIIDAWAGDVPARAITRKMVQDLYEPMQAVTPSKANHVIGMLRILFQFGLNKGWVDSNPAARPDTIGTGNRDAIWSDASIQAMVEMADALGWASVGTAILLAQFIGQRQGDILRVRWSTYQSGLFVFRQGKTQRLVEIPAHEDLKQRLDTLARDARPIVINERTNKPWNEHTFRHVFAEIRTAAIEQHPELSELKDLWFMDLRRTAVVRLAEAGCTEIEIAAVTGHKIETCRQILEVYCPRTGVMAANAIRKLTEYRERAENKKN